jgi:hypothetical protein
MVEQLLPGISSIIIYDEDLYIVGKFYCAGFIA